MWGAFRCCFFQARIDRSFFFFNERTQWGESKQSQFENNHQLKVVQIDAKNNESTSDGSSDNKATAETETARHAS